jgi:hypothetical protein
MNGKIKGISSFFGLINIYQNQKKKSLACI